MENNKLKIYLAAPRGFCAGVDRAIEIVKKSLDKYGAPVYVRHEIVHNKHVVESLKEIGAVFVEELEEIHDKSRPVIFSAHGVPKSVIKEASNLNMIFIDATCPLVSKVHREAENLYRHGMHIILIGHENHPEVIGTMGQLPDGAIDLIQSVTDAENYDPKTDKNLAYITQTTLSIDDTSEIISCLSKRFPKIHSPKKEDICYATTNRQNAIKDYAHECDSFIVVGSKNSSNSNRLVEVAKKSGCDLSVLLENASNLNIDNYKNHQTIGLSSGASVPDILVQDVISKFREAFEINVKEVGAGEENISFKLPRGI